MTSSPEVNRPSPFRDVNRLDAVRITDLDRPRFPDEVLPALAAMAELAPACPLEPAALLEAAADQTGLSDFGEPSFRERLDVLCAALRTEAGLSAAGVVNVYSQLLQLLKNRLLVTDLLARHPEIAHEVVADPIVICGMPRTGTTHLHNLIAADPAMRSLPYWESVEPVLSPAERADHDRAGADRPDPRVERTSRAVEFVDSAMPYFRRMHEMSADHAHEEIQLLAIDFSTMFFETMAPIPTWRDYYRAHDQSPHYRYLHTVLQVLQWLRGGRRWVLKSPQHLEQFGPMQRAFPGAVFVMTHRDPVPVTVSMATMVAYTARLSLAEVDPVAIGRYWSSRVEDLLGACVDHRDRLPADRATDVRFAEFMRDDLATVRRIYDLAGQPWSEDTARALGGYLDTHRRGRHGTIRFDPPSVGIDVDERGRALAFYRERFHVPVEPSLS
jgi:hypothetical protein